MCLNYKDGLTEEKLKEPLTVYKVFLSEVLKTCVFGHKMKIGLNRDTVPVEERNRNFKFGVDTYNILYGFHSFLSLKDARIYSDGLGRIYECVIPKNCTVVYGKQYDNGLVHEAVCSRTLIVKNEVG